MPVDLRWRRVQELVESAELRPAAEREAWVCSQEPDTTVRAEVFDLLTALEEEAAATRAAARAAPVPSLPDFIGPYRISALIGSGGRGSVYRGHRQVAGTWQTVAVKVLLDHLIGAEDLERFRREQRILAGLNHPAIARFLDAGREPSGRHYLILEWIDGVTIDRYCEREKLSLEARVRLIAEVLDGLQAAHQNLVVHLDLKPSNILIDSNGQVRLIDFGTAKLLASEAASTQTRQLTPHYASPEQLRGEPLSTASDLYSIGITLHELVTGKFPFPGGSSLAAIAGRASGEPPSLSVAGAPDLEAILGKALRPDPKDRYRTAAEFGDDLRALLGGRPVGARRPTVSYRLRRFVGRNRRGVAAALVLAVALSATGAYAFREQRRRLAEAERSAAIARFLHRMIDSSATAAAGRPNMTVLEMVERANARIEAGLGPPLDVSAMLQANFAYFARESGREDLAEPMARAAVRRADESADPSARLAARQTLAEIQLRLGRCAEALTVLREADGIFVRSRNSIAPVRAASFLSSRATSKSRCESDPAAAIRLLEDALAVSAALQPAESAVPPAVVRAALYNSYALELSRLRRFDDARKAVDRGFALAESHPDGRYFQVSLLRIRGQVETSAGNPASALESFERAAALAPGTANAFEELRLQLMAAARQAETGNRGAAAERARATLEQARARSQQIGPSLWMLLNEAAEVYARAGQCERAFALYREADTLTNGQLPNDWRGNRLFFEAECHAGSDPARAATLAREAAQVYGLLLHPDSARARRLRELTAPH